MRWHISDGNMACSMLGRLKKIYIPWADYVPELGSIAYHSRRLCFNHIGYWWETIKSEVEVMDLETGVKQYWSDEGVKQHWSNEDAFSVYKLRSFILSDRYLILIWKNRYEGALFMGVVGVV